MSDPTTTPREIAHAFAVPCRLVGLEVDDEHHAADLVMATEADIEDGIETGDE